MIRVACVGLYEISTADYVFAGYDHSGVVLGGRDPSHVNVSIPS